MAIWSFLIRWKHCPLVIVLMVNPEPANIIFIIIVISFFKVDFCTTFYNYKKPINVNLPLKLAKNSDTKQFGNSLL